MSGLARRILFPPSPLSFFLVVANLPTSLTSFFRGRDRAGIHFYHLSRLPEEHLRPSVDPKREERAIRGVDDYLKSYLDPGSSPLSFALSLCLSRPISPHSGICIIILCFSGIFRPIQEDRRAFRYPGLEGKSVETGIEEGLGCDWKREPDLGRLSSRHTAERERT